jgi:hypothetical protein
MINQNFETTKQTQDLQKELEQRLQAAFNQITEDIGKFNLGVTIEITQDRGENVANILITFQEKTLAVLSGVNVKAISQSDFTRSNF